MIGNAFLVNSSNSIYHYKLSYLDGYIDAKDQYTIKWNDPSLNIKWGLNEPILSPRDK